VNGQLAKNASELLIKLNGQVDSMNLTDADPPEMRQFVGAMATTALVVALLVEAVEQVADAIANKKIEFGAP
jgi:hypothetical protein